MREIRLAVFDRKDLPADAAASAGGVPVGFTREASAIPDLVEAGPRAGSEES